MKKIIFIITLALCALQVNVNAQIIAAYPLVGNSMDYTGNYGNSFFTWNPINPQLPDVFYTNGACLNGIFIGDPGGQLFQTPELTTLDTNSFELSCDFTLNSLPSPFAVVMSIGNVSYPVSLLVFNNGVSALRIKVNGSWQTYNTTTLISTGQWYSVRIKHSYGTTQVKINGVNKIYVTTQPIRFTSNGTIERTVYVNPGGQFNGCVKNLNIYNSIFIATAPADITVPSNGNCGANVSFTPGTVVGTPVFFWTYSTTTGSFFSVGTHTITAVVLNGAFTDTSTFTVTVTPNDAPIFVSCPASIIVTPTAGNCFASPILIYPLVTDCDGNPLSVTNDAPLAFSTGTTVVTWTAYNGSIPGTCTQNVTVNDVTNPVLNCPANITVTADAGQCSKTVTFSNPTITDCCILPTGPIAGYPGMTYIGTFQNHSYYKNTTVTNASIAYTQAVGAGGYLAAINSAAENAFLDAAAGSTFYWIGGYQNTNNPNYSEPNGGWEWLTGEPFTYTNWGPAQPDNSGGIENNLMFAANFGQWFDMDYNSTAASIVEFECTAPAVVTTGNPSGSSFPVGTSTVSWQATDRSGNIGTCNFTVTVIDTVPPVINCPANIAVNAPAGSCQQLVNYALPLVTDNCSPPPTSVVGLNYLGSYGGHTYFKLGSTTTWSASNAAAIGFGASLVSINDAGENAFLQSVLPGFGNFWIGGFQNHASGSYAEPSGGWEWLDGSNFNAYTNWAAGLPDNAFGVEDNLTYNASNGTWQDNYDNNTFVQAIVEFSSSIVPVLIAGQPSGSVFNAGTTTVTYAATDISGNSDTCSFTVTVNVITPPTWYQDADLDGYYTSSSVTQCSAPAGLGWTTSAGSGGGDCNDNNNAVHPGATEILCNGIDENCNGMGDEGTIASYSISGNASFCAGGSTTLNAGAGYTNYNWSTGATTQTISVSTVGTFTVTVTSGNGCTGVASATTNIASCCNISLSGIVTNTSCHGSGNGAINVTSSNSSGSPAYLWNNGNTNEDRTGLTAGTYTVTVTYSGSCTESQTFNVSQPASLSINGTKTNINCRGSNTGAIILTPSGATGPYTFLWNNGSTLQNRSNLAAGNYTVTVNDFNNCGAIHKIFTITQPATQLILNTNKTNIRCYGLNSGTITVTPAGGSAPYVYSWNTFPVKTTATISGLVASVYSCTVTDANNCTKTVSVTLTEPPAINIIPTQGNVTVHGGNNGSASVLVSGGTPGYTYTWNTIPVKTTASVTGLTAGTYKCIVSDIKYCQMKKTFNITEPASRLNVDHSVSSFKMLVFPNPSHGNMIVKLSGLLTDESIDLIVTDAAGKKVYNYVSFWYPDDEKWINLNTLSKGFYFMHCKSSSGNIIQKIIIN